MSRNSCDLCGGIADSHTADCPNRVDDRVVVVAEALAAHRLNKGLALCNCGAELGGTGNRMDAWRAHVTTAILTALDGAPAPQVQAARASGDEACAVCTPHPDHGRYACRRNGDLCGCTGGNSATHGAPA